MRILWLVVALVVSGTAASADWNRELIASAAVRPSLAVDEVGTPHEDTRIFGRFASMAIDDGGNASLAYNVDPVLWYARNVQYTLAYRGT